MLAWAPLLLGAIVLWLPAFRYRIDVASCAGGPLPWTVGWSGAALGLAYAVAVALLTLGWRRSIAAAERRRWSLGRVIALGALVHAVAIVAPPFTSNDPLFYVAIGRAERIYDQRGGVENWSGDAGAAQAMATLLPAGDPLLARLPTTSSDWQHGTSPYGPLFNRVARAIAAISDDTTVQLRVYQALNAALIVAGATLVGLGAGAPTAAAVVLCPLAITDGSVNPHNDAWLLLAVAVYVFAAARGRSGWSLPALFAALAVKLSGALLLAFDLLRRAFAPVAARLPLRRTLVVGALLAVAAVVALFAAVQRWPQLAPYAALLGDPDERSPHFSRSFEALPRAALVYVLHCPRPSFVIGLVFRAAAALWIAGCALACARDRQPHLLSWAATTLFVYYLLFHAFLQPWYIVPLLPLLPSLPAYMQRSARIFVVALSGYYAIGVPLDCDYRPIVLGVKELVVACLVILPAFFTLLAAWRRQRRARASA